MLFGIGIAVEEQLVRLVERNTSDDLVVEEFVLHETHLWE